MLTTKLTQLFTNSITHLTFPKAVDKSWIRSPPVPHAPVRSSDASYAAAPAPQYDAGARGALRRARLGLTVCAALGRRKTHNC